MVQCRILHKRIKLNSTLFDLYNPLNLIIDFKVRDFAEYIKDCLINDGDYKSIIDKIFKKLTLFGSYSYSP